MTPKAPAEMVSLDPLTCSKCKIEVGRMVLIGGVEWVQIGGLILRMAHGNCIACGEPYHFAVSDKVLKEFIKGDRK